MNSSPDQMSTRRRSKQTPQEITSALDRCQESFHVLADAFVCNVGCDSALTRAVAERTIGFFYPIRPGVHVHPSVNIYISCRAQEQMPIFEGPTQTREMVIVGYPAGGERGLTWSAGDWMVVHNPENGVGYAVNILERSVILQIPAAGAVELPLLRMIRLMCDCVLSRRGHSRLHAAAVAFGDQAMLIVGNRASGKTTAMFEILTSIGGKILAFDKVFIRPSQQGIDCLGIPTTLGIGIGTAKRYGLFLESFPSRLCNLRVEDTWRVNSEEDKARITPTLVAQRFHPAREGPYRLATVVFPSLDRKSGCRLSTLSRETGIERLTDNLILGNISPYEKDWVRLEAGSIPFEENTKSLRQALEMDQGVSYFCWSLGCDYVIEATKEILVSVMRAGTLTDQNSTPALRAEKQSSKPALTLDSRD